jgi:signal transduction histidine kinase
VVETIRPLVRANANTLHVQCPPDIGVMRADMSKTRQSLFNLLSNAAKFTREGTISLEVSRETWRIVSGSGFASPTRASA